LITINPAKQLGIENRVGSLEVGKDGDVAIFKNHPLSIYGVPQYSIVDGIVRFDRAKDPNDMRLMPDPKETVEVTFFENGHDNCMEGVEDLFGLNQNERKN
jgi:urease alpha subunit